MTHLVDSLSFDWCNIIAMCILSARFISGTCTRENANVVTDLQASCNKSVHQVDIRKLSHCLFPVVPQMWNKLLATWYVMLTTSLDLLQVVPTSLISLARNKLLQVWRQLASSRWVKQPNSVTTCSQTCYKVVANTSCWQDERLFSSCVVHVTYNLIGFLRRWKYIM